MNINHIFSLGYSQKKKKKKFWNKNYHSNAQLKYRTTRTNRCTHLLLNVLIIPFSKQQCQILALIYHVEYASMDMEAKT